MTPAQALALLVAKKQRLPRRRKPQLHLEPDSSAAALPVTPRGKQSSFWKTKQSPRASPQGAKRGRLQMLSARRGYSKQRSCLWQPKSAEGSATRKENLFSTPCPCSQPPANSNWLEAFCRYLSCLYFQVYGRWRETMAASCSPGCSPRRAGGGSASSSKKTNPELILPCLPALLRDPGLLLTHSSCEHGPELLLAGSALSQCHKRGTTGPGSPSQAEIYPFLQFLPQSSAAALRYPFLHPPPAPGARQTPLRWLLALRAKAGAGI